MKRSAAEQAPQVQTETQGDVPRAAVDRARAKVLWLAGRVPQPILFVRVKLTRRANPAVERPAIAQATIDVNGRPARAHVAAETMDEAVDLLQDRLAHQLARLSEHWEARRGATPVAAPHEWRHASEPAQRPDHYPRPVEERRIVRHKSYSLARETPDEAVYELEAMDYDFHLFTEAASGQDSVLYRSGPTGYRLAQLHPRPDLFGPVAAPLTVSDLPVPRMSAAEAQKRLDLTGFPFVFFADAATGRGNVLYHRYDGHYGLITPAG